MEKTGYLLQVATHNGYPVYKTVYTDGERYYIIMDGNEWDVTTQKKDFV